MELGDSGRHVAGELAAGGQARIYAQVLFEKTETGQIGQGLVGPDRDSIEALLTAARERLTDEVALVEKHGAKDFTKTALTWDGARYRAGPSERIATPPPSCIWFEAEHVPGTAASRPSWTVYRLPTGQLVGRVPDLAHLRALLSLLRMDLDVLANRFHETEVESESTQPNVHMRMVADVYKLDRTFVKIGLNLTAHLFGTEVVRQSIFDDAVAYALGHGKPVPRGQIQSDVLGPPLKGRHVFHLGSYPLSTGRLGLVLMLRLYDTGTIESFVLAELASSIPQLQSTVVHVDYVSNQIVQMSLQEHLLRGLLD